VNKEEFEKIKVDNDRPVTISTNELWDKTPRTLLSGKTVWRHSWRLYMDERRQLWINIAINKNLSLVNRCFGSKVPIDEIFDDSVYSPTQLYPEQCDYAFCALLIAKGVRLPFESFKEEVVACGVRIGG